MKKYTTTIILVAIFAVLTAFFYFYEADKEDKDDIDNSLTSKTFNVWEINTDNVKSISIKQGDQDIKVVKQEDNTWQMKKPKDQKADLEKVNAILDEYKVIEGKGEKIEDVDLKDFALDEPKGTVKLKFNDDIEREIIFGDSSIDETNIYAKVFDQDYVFLTDKYLYDKIKIKANDLKQAEEKKE